MATYSKTVETAYAQRNKKIIIALTGRTGSGCSTVAKILKQDYKKLALTKPKSMQFDTADERKYAIIHKFMEAGNWHPFTVIAGSAVILSFVIERGCDGLVAFLKEYQNNKDEDAVSIDNISELIRKISGLSELFKAGEGINNSRSIAELNKDETKKYYEYYINILPNIRNEFQLLLKSYSCHQEITDKKSKKEYVRSNLYTYLMQQIGNNIRSTGNPYSSSDKYTEKSFYAVAERIDYIIQLIEKYNKMNNISDPVRICIDALRNPYEAFYFRDKYSSFYLVSVNTEEEKRIGRLRHLNEEERKSLDKIEYPEKFEHDYDVFFHQNIAGCLAISDIHLYNPEVANGKFFDLTEQLIRYISLMIHPGLITPTNLERCMQLAYNAKLNSGCLSRQVGAVICDQNYSVKAVGWNDVPAGQVPCNLRDICSYCKNSDEETYSQYELNDPVFIERMQKIQEIIKDKTELSGRTYPFCFKDVYQSITGEKNQVHTRSLHAEENAFLQLAKYGGRGIEGGILFTTASPCELCSKKAYQLGIKDIYYIDPYPGISFSHILGFGKLENVNNPRMHLFHGAIGGAYFNLYTQRMGVKDELELLSGIHPKDKKLYSKVGFSNKEELKSIRYEKRIAEFKFISREHIVLSEQKYIEARRDNISELYDGMVWSGDAFDKPVLDLYIDKEGKKATDKVVIETVKEQNSPSYNIIKLPEPLNEKDKCTLFTRLLVYDTYHVMRPYFSQYIGAVTEEQIILVKVPSNLIEKVQAVEYASADMLEEWEVSRKKLKKTTEKDFDVYTFNIKKPKLNYTYSIEWNFCKE